MAVVVTGGDLMYKAKPKLAVETNDKTDADLRWLIENEEPTEDGQPLNETTIVNRAVQMYAVMMRARQEGKDIYVGTLELDRVQWS
jgi:hypothetical protein